MIPKIKLGNTDEEIPVFALGTWDIRNRKEMIKTIRYAGVSNFKTTELEKAINIFKPFKVVNNQVEYNLDNFRYVEDELLPLLRLKSSFY